MTKEARIYNGEKTISSASGGEKATCKSMKLEHTLTLYTKINSKWLKDLSIRHDTMKLLDENMSRTFSDRNCTNVFLGQSPKAKEIKVKINKWDLFKLTSFCTAKQTMNKMKRQPTDRENIFAIHAMFKGLISKINSLYNSITTTTKKPQNPINKQAEELNRHFSKEYIQMANKSMKRYSTSPTIRELQIKTTMKYHLTSVRMVITKKATNKCWRGYGEKGTLLH